MNGWEGVLPDLFNSVVDRKTFVFQNFLARVSVDLVNCDHVHRRLKNILKLSLKYY